MDKDTAISRIKELLNNKFETLIENLEKDLVKKYDVKKKQFIYSEIFSDKTLLDLAFTSSIESKMGNILNNLLVDILRDKELANFLGWKSIEDIEKEKEFKGKLYIEGKDFKLKCEYRDETKILDLILIDIENTTINLFEIKAGGNLDSKKGHAEVERLKEAEELAKSLYPDKEINIYFATLYNPKGEEHNPEEKEHNPKEKETDWFPYFLKNNLDKNNIKIGKNFWEFLFNNKLDFEDLKKAYKEVAQEKDIEKRIEEIKNKILFSEEIKREFENLEKKKKDMFKYWIKTLCPSVKEISSRKIKNIEIYLCYKDKKELFEFIYRNLEHFKKEFREENKEKSYSKNLKEFLEWACDKYKSEKTIERLINEKYQRIKELQERLKEKTKPFWKSW